MGWRRATEDDSVRRLKLGNFHVSLGVEFNLDVFEMGFVVGSGVYSNDLHQSVCRRIGGKSKVTKSMFQSFLPLTPECQDQITIESAEWTKSFV